jgi:hypothetical protein
MRPLWLALLAAAAPAFAQGDLRAIRELDEELPGAFINADPKSDFERQKRRYWPPKRVIQLEKIKQSPVVYGAIRKGAYLRNLETNQNYQVARPMYVKCYSLEDENEFKYVLDKNGDVRWRVRSRYVEPIREELSLYVSPVTYAPAPENLVRSFYDDELTVPPEVSFFVGRAQGDYMSDLFEDRRARGGTSNQYGLHFFTQWKLPLKAGAVIHYERASYNLRGGGRVLYSAPSLGPQLKSRDFDVFGRPLRFQAQFRVSPFARATADTVFGSGTFKFNSTDVLAAAELPIKNRFGEFVVGLYYQSQWLNLKDQEMPVRVRAANQTNKSWGLSFGQVFQ